MREVTLSGLPQLPGVMTVAMNGGMQQAAAHFQINEFVRQAAEQMGGVPHFLHAPYTASPMLRDAFLADAGVQQIISLWDNLDVAIVGVGLTHHAPHARNHHRHRRTSRRSAMPQAMCCGIT